jgi:glycosyltransferase involved in cell wall biosynthesis
VDTRQRIALVHDYLLVLRGAERTFAAMSECWPEAPIFTLLYDAKVMRSAFGHRDVRTSYLQRLGVTQSHFRRLLPLFPRAAERLPLAPFNVVISSSSAFAHGVRPRPGALHICYCHTPFRYVWHERKRALEETPASLRPAVASSLDRIRRWDREVARRVDHYIANSEFTRRRIQDFWGRDARVIHPPVAVERFGLGEPRDYFLTVGELVPHKRVELALEAARRSGKHIKVVGTGPSLAALRARYAHTAEFLGRVSDAELADLYAHAVALVVPNVEEFGIAAVEAQAAGTPVLAVDAGGVKETVVQGETGLLVDPERPDTMAEAMAQTDFLGFDREHIQRHAQSFSAAAFQGRLITAVEQQLGTPQPVG